MNTLRNKVQLIGNLGNNPEIRSFEDGNKLARLSLATREIYKNNKGEKVTETYWHNLVAWGKTAELADRLLKKGSEVAVEGKLVTRNYEDKQGVKRYVTEVVVSEFVLLDKKDNS
jgi:single-strand DNA-binding protein